MKDQNEILNEIQELMPSVVGHNKKALYKAPEQYFEELPQRILNLAKASENPFKLPENYFETFSQKVLQKVQASENNNSVLEELKEIAPTLSTISKTNPYSVPENYFESLQFKAPATKVVNMRFTQRIITYAAAAVMAGVLITGAFVYNTAKTSFDLSKEAKSYSDEELNAFLNNNTQNTTTSEYSFNQLNEPVSLKENLQLYSDEELKEYLNENDHTEKINSDINEGS